jgi:hypothetical protein
MKKTALLVMLVTLSTVAMAEEVTLEAPPEMEAMITALGGLLVLIGLAALIVQILFILSVNKTIRAVRTEHSGASEVMAWLMIIPLIGWICAIITVVKLAEDYKLYVREHQLTVLYGRDGGQMKGLIAFIASICGIIPVIGLIAGLVGLVFYILYWIELGDLRKSIEIARSNANG